jgi:hypothetical protein
MEYHVGCRAFIWVCPEYHVGCRVYVGMSGMSEMSEMKRGSVGNVGIVKCQFRDRVGSTRYQVEHVGTDVPIREDKCRRRTGSRFEHLSETGTNEDSETVHWGI